MSDFDVVPQSTPRRVDAQASRTDMPAGKNEQGRQAPEGSGSFTALLHGLGERKAQPATSDAQVPVAPGAAGPGEAERGSGPSGDQQPIGADWLADLFQAVAADTPADQDSAGAKSDQPDNSPISALATLLPHLFDGTQPTAADGEQRPGAGTLESACPGTALPDSGPPGLAQPSVLKLSVQKQETHFRPVIEGFTIKAAPQDEGDPTSPGAGQPDGPAAGIAGTSGNKSNIDARLDPAAGVSLPDAVAPKASGTAADEASAAGRAVAGHQSSRLDTRAPQQEAASTPHQASSLPHPMLHRIAGAVLAHLGPMAAEAGNQTGQAGSASFLATVKASENVVRVLSVELHPAELGAVTIKLRLSGDNLEMDLQVASEKTAALLKNDSGRLTALLRDSGYRPDAINIQVGPADARQDASLNLRPHSMSQTQQQAFSQGMAHHERRPQRDGQDAPAQKGHRSDANDGDIVSDRRISGVYL